MYVLALSYLIVVFYIEVFRIFFNPYDYILLFSKLKAYNFSHFLSTIITAP
jgi:hypothetical protein